MTMETPSNFDLEGLKAAARASLDPECICQGNWRKIIEESNPLIDRRYVDEKGNVWNFFGVVHGGDDFYYGMWREEHMVLLSCVGSIEGHGFKLLDKPTAGELLGEPEVLKLLSAENGFTDKSKYPFVEGKWNEEKGAEAFCRALGRSEAWREARRLIWHLRHRFPANTDDPQRTVEVLSALESAECAIVEISQTLKNGEVPDSDDTIGYLQEVLSRVRAASALLQFKPKEAPYEVPKGKGVVCPHCSGTRVEQPVYEEETGWTEGGPCPTCSGHGRLYTAEQYVAALPANWFTDSALETWFPLTAEERRRERAELDALREENAALKSQLTKNTPVHS